MPENSEKTLIIKDSTLKNGFTSVPNIVLTSNISFGAKVIYALLLMFAWQNKETFPGQSRLAQAAGCTERTVRTYLSELKKIGLITWKQRGLTKTNIYYINELSSFSDRKDPSGQDRKQTDKKNGSGSDRKDSSVQDRNHTSDKEYTDEKDTDQEYSVSVSNDSLRSSLDTRGQQKLEMKHNDNNPSNETLEGDSVSSGVNNKKLVERNPVMNQETPNTNANVINKKPPVEKKPLPEQEIMLIETGADSKEPPVVWELDSNQNTPSIEPGVNFKRPPGKKETTLDQDTLHIEAGDKNIRPPEEKKPLPEQEIPSIESGGNKKPPVKKEQQLNQETPQITNSDLITALGDSLRDSWDGPPAKAYAIAGRMYYLYDYPAAEAAVNIFCRRVGQGFKPKNPVAYLMKTAREKQKEFESQEEPQQDSELEYFSAKYPEEHRKRVEAAKRVRAEHEQYLHDFLDDESPPGIAGFITPGQKFQKEEGANASSGN
jgi:hypothetical protein